MVNVIAVWLTGILNTGIASFVLRLALAAIFLVHGYPKLKNLKGTTEFLAGLGFKPAAFWAVVLGATEFFGGIGLLLGFLSRIAGGLLIIVMTVAIMVHLFKWKTPFTKSPGVGWEFDAMILAGLIALFLLGPGVLSLDSLIFSLL